MSVFFVVAGAYVGAMMVFILAFAELDAAGTAEVAVGLVLSGWSIFRLSRCGVHADRDGVRVVNPVSMTCLRWEEIARFVHEAQGSCRVERRDGSRVSMFGIREPTWSPRRSGRTRAAALIDELNRRLGGR